MAILGPRCTSLPYITMLALGIDPDTNDTAFAWWDNDGPAGAAVAHVVRRKGDWRCNILRTAHAINIVESRPDVWHAAVEGQQVDARKVPVRDLFKLAHVTGLAIGYVCERHPNARLFVPTPTEWKGGVAKHAMQARLYKDLGWGYTITGIGYSRYARPINPPSTFRHITKGQWKHVGDALLLARWACNQNKS